MDYNTNLELNTSGIWKGVITGILYFDQKNYSIVAVEIAKICSRINDTITK